MILATHGIVGSQIVQLTGFLLDDYPNASVAYSLRLLRSAYTGSAIRVRRASDNTEQNIGFSNNQLDTSALTSFCSGTNGFVTTWYDQSGNGRNATQTTAANQPQIVSSGNVLTQNGKPILKFSTSNQMNTSEINVDGVDSSFFMTYKKSSAGDNVVLLKDGGKFIWLNYGNIQYYGDTDINDADFNTTDYMLVGATMDYNVKLNWYKNNILQQTKTSSFVANQRMTSIFNTGFARVESFTNEIIIYASNQDSNANAIQTNINDFYSIY
jgi:hypothetical protein